MHAHHLGSLIIDYYLEKIKSFHLVPVGHRIHNTADFYFEETCERYISTAYFLYSATAKSHVKVGG
ncbi:MAG TPA: hypothetical protein PKV73_13165 [Agriterribacter sp.]|nr:hypothetical protein [Agriterribacter sp.]